jgi:hypothetical protein
MKEKSLHKNQAVAKRPTYATTPLTLTLPFGQYLSAKQMKD